jgi:4-amino-4-deoxy-L-arabinose transferase-like glycosyltransferase
VAVVGAFLYATNPNILYLGITSMTEAPFMLFFTVSAYFFQKWLQQSQSLKDLILCSIFLSFATLCRYEGWFLPLFLIIIASVFAMNNKEKTQKQKIFAILASLISLSSIAFWLAWNQYHYGDPFEFSKTQYYSASWYALNRPFRDILFLQPANVMSVYGTTAFVMYGPVLLTVAGAGYFFIYRKNPITGKNAVLLFLGLPALFTIISLLIGIGEMSYWFNSRFMVLLSPLVIVMASLALGRFVVAVNKNRMAVAAGIGMLFVWQVLTPAFSNIVTISDAKGGYSVKENMLAIETGEALKSIYDGKGNIMILTGSGLEQRIMITAGIPLKKFDEIIESSTWKTSFKEPWSYDRWIVITRNPGTDALTTTKYWLDRSEVLEKYYATVYENELYKIMVIK